MVGAARYHAGIAFDDQGAGLPLVLVHAFPLNRRMWRPQMEHLRARFRVVAPDLPGFGESAAGSAPFSMERCADEVAALLDHLGLDRAVLGGLSMGGYVAFAFVRRHPDRLRGLVLADTRAGADTETARAGRREMAALALREGTRAVAERMVPRLLGDGTLRTRPQVAAEVRALIEKTAPDAIARAQEAMAARSDSTELLARIAVPTLVLVGGQDALTPPSEAEAMVRAIPGARLQVIPGAGHLSNLEAPEAFNEALESFLQSLS